MIEKGGNLVNSMQLRNHRLQGIVAPSGGSRSVVNYRNYKLESNNDNAIGKLLALFNGNQEKYDLFVNKLLGYFFKDKYFKEIFNNCGRNLDEFLKLVFGASKFGFDRWGIRVVNIGSRSKMIVWSKLVRWSKLVKLVSVGASSSFFRDVIRHLSEIESIVRFEYAGQVSWADRISAILLGCWLLAEYNLEPSNSGPVLNAETPDKLGKVFVTISECVKENLSAAGRDYNGKELKQVD